MLIISYATDAFIATAGCEVTRFDQGDRLSESELENYCGREIYDAARYYLRPN